MCRDRIHLQQPTRIVYKTAWATLEAEPTTLSYKNSAKSIFNNII